MASGATAATGYASGVASALGEALLYGALSVGQAAVQGEADAARLLAYFGIGIVDGFLSGTAATRWASAAGGGATLSKELARSMVVSTLKNRVDEENNIALRIFVVDITIDKDSNVEVDGNFEFLAAQGALLGLAALGGGDGDKILRKYLRSGSLGVDKWNKEKIVDSVALNGAAKHLTMFGWRTGISLTGSLLGIAKAAMGRYSRANAYVGDTFITDFNSQGESGLMGVLGGAEFGMNLCKDAGACE
jgi:hypothetical protein